tara:strand:+ start:41 stop:868 length:828 start_codon:yes stop_codon:yes gene_type:complete
MEENNNEQGGAGAPPISEREQVEQQALARFRESQQSQAEKDAGMPEGYNPDGTKQEEMLGGKFKSQEDLLKAYQELEKKIGQPKQEPAEAKAEENKSEAPKEEQAPSSLSVAAYEQEFVEKGSLSDTSYANLEKMGFTRTQVDQYIQGQQAYAETVRGSIYESVGGQQEYVDIINWASVNMPPATIKEYNSAVDAVDKDKVIAQLEYMKFKRDQAQPQTRETRRLEGNAPTSGLQPYTDKNEWQKAATDRLYGKDAKYTNMVDQRYLAARKRGIL